MNHWRSPKEPLTETQVKNQMYVNNNSVGKSAAYLMAIDQFMLDNGHKVSQEDLDTLQTVVKRLTAELDNLQRTIRSEQFNRIIREVGRDN